MIELPSSMSILQGPPLASEAGLGSLTLSGYIAELADRYAAREAVVQHVGNGTVIRWSYSKLYEEARLVARALTAQGLAKGETVAVLLSNRPEWLTSVFGVMLAGGIAAPLSTFSSAPELSYLIKASGASTLIYEPRVANRNFDAVLDEMEPTLGTCASQGIAVESFPFLRRIVTLGDTRGAKTTWQDFISAGESVSDALIDARAAAIAPADAALLYFSSGSTGKPKAILNAHRGVAIQCWRWARLLGFKVEDDIRGWGANGFFWSGSFAQTVGATFSAGGSLVLQPTFNAEEALDLFERERVNYLVCWPHQYARFAEAANWRRADLSSLRYVTIGTPLERHPTFQSTWKEPACSYGSTETFTINTCLPVGRPEDSYPDNHGVPLPGNWLKIVDPLTGIVVPRGQSGEIGVKGPTLMLGYLGVPLDETLDEEGYFLTGDGGRIDELGRLHWEGRLTDIIKTGGANVSPAEIDATLIDYVGVQISQTVGIPHEQLGEMIVTCVVPSEGKILDDEHMRAWLRDRIASYKVPRHILFVKRSEITFTGSAKIRTTAMRDFVAKRLLKPVCA